MIPRDSSHSPPSATPHPGTPRLDALLSRLQSRLRSGVWLHGIGTVVLALALWLLFMYVADRVLELPAPIRIFHLAVLVLGTAFVAARTLLRNARAVPERDALALLAQRALPAEDRAGDLFVGAVQLPRQVAPDAPAAGLVRRVIEGAEAQVERADLGSVTDVGGPRWRASLGALAVLGTGAALGANPAMARIFGARMLGANVPWPRATTLFIEIPDAESGVSVDTADPEVIRVRAARGTDVPVFVRAEGEVPDFVTLRFEESGAALDVAPGGPASFRTVIASVQDDATVRITGGDDDRGEPRIEIEVLQPPDLSAIVFQVTPPAYTGQNAFQRSEVTSVRVLAGSEVEVHVAPDPGDATGIARTFPDDGTIELAAGAFPALGGAERDGEDPGAAGSSPNPAAGLHFTRTVNESLRFRFELVDSSGLSNPDPALFGIEVFEDASPEVLLLSPARTDLALVLSSAIPLRALVRDDLRVEGVQLEIFDGITDDRIGARPLELVRSSDVDEAGAAKDAALASMVVEVQELRPDESLGEGAVVALRVVAEDGRAPEPNRTDGAPITLRIVSRDSFLQRQRDALRIQAETVGRLRERIDEVEASLADLVASTLGDEAEAPSSGLLTGVQNEARRLQGDLGALSRDLGDIAEAHVFSRIDERAGALEQRLVELMAPPSVRGCSAEVWSTLGADLAAGRAGSPTTAGELVQLVALALEGAGPRASTWIEALGRARSAGDDLEASRAALAESQAALEDLRVGLDQLASILGEWDSMQSIQARARDILNSSKNLAERLKKQAEGK